MNIKKGDKVIVVTGKDKGKSGEVIRAFPREGKVVVAGVAVAKRHERARKGKQKGQVVDTAMPIHASNVMILDPEKNKPTRISVKREKGKAVRVAKKSGAELK
ncbi:MAG TPA: 50S ribosomal protein L24 [Candidatus Paceibacterota bacterium]|nr:50S ribosomal protein L24 [Candidatus Paceibacterota bacterium]